VRCAGGESLRGLFSGVEAVGSGERLGLRLKSVGGARVCAGEVFFDKVAQSRRPFSLEVDAFVLGREQALRILRGEAQAHLPSGEGQIGDIGGRNDRYPPGAGRRSELLCYLPAACQKLKLGRGDVQADTGLCPSDFHEIGLRFLIGAGPVDDFSNQELQGAGDFGVAERKAGKSGGAGALPDAEASPPAACRLDDLLYQWLTVLRIPGERVQHAVSDDDEPFSQGHLVAAPGQRRAAPQPHRLMRRHQIELTSGGLRCGGRSLRRGEGQAATSLPDREGLYMANVSAMLRVTDRRKIRTASLK